jgi:hypothetical protein
MADPRAQYMNGLLDALMGIPDFPRPEVFNVDDRQRLANFRLLIEGEGLLNGIFGADPTVRDETLNDLVREALAIFGPFMPIFSDPRQGAAQGAAQAAVQAEVRRRAAGAEGVQNAVAFLFAGIGAQIQRLQRRQAPPPAGQGWIDQFIEGATAIWDTFMDLYRRAREKIKSAFRAGMEGLGLATALLGVAGSALVGLLKGVVFKITPEEFITLEIDQSNPTIFGMFNAWREARHRKSLPDTENTVYDFIDSITYIASSLMEQALTRDGIVGATAKIHLAAGEEVAVALRHLLSSLFRFDANRATIDSIRAATPNARRRDTENRLLVEILCADFVQAYYEFISAVNALNATRDIAYPHAVANLTAYSAVARLGGAGLGRQVSGIGMKNSGTGAEVKVLSSALEASAIELRPKYNLCVAAIPEFLVDGGPVVNRGIAVLTAALPAEDAMFPGTQAARLALVRSLHDGFSEYLSQRIPDIRLEDPTRSRYNANHKLAALQARMEAAEAAADVAVGAAIGDDAEAVRAGLSRAAIKRRTIGMGSADLTRVGILLDRIEDAVRGAGAAAAGGAGAARNAAGAAAAAAGGAGAAAAGGASSNPFEVYNPVTRTFVPAPALLPAAAAAAGRGSGSGAPSGPPAGSVLLTEDRAFEAVGDASIGRRIYHNPRDGRYYTENGIPVSAAAAGGGAAAAAAPAPAMGASSSSSAAGAAPPLRHGLPAGLMAMRRGGPPRPPPAGATNGGVGGVGGVKRPRGPTGPNGPAPKRPETNAAYAAGSSLMRPAAITTISGRAATRNPDGSATYDVDGTLVDPSDIQRGGYRRRRRTHRRRHHVTHKRSQPRRVHRVKASRRRTGGKSRKAGRR